MLIEQQLLISPSPQPLATTILLSVSNSLTTLDTSYKWNHTVFVFCNWLISFSIMSSSFIHMQHLTGFLPFLRLSNLPLYVHITYYLSVHSSIDIWVASMSWLLWIMLLWTWTYKYLFKILLLILLTMYSEAALHDHIEILFLIFFGISIVYSTAAAPSYIPTNTAVHLVSNSPPPC